MTSESTWFFAQPSVRKNTRVGRAGERAASAGRLALLPSRAMRIGVISDTHDNARNVARIVSVLREARVERVIHTGDITRPRTLAALAAVQVPLFGVYGNNDVERGKLAEVALDHG